MTAAAIAADVRSGTRQVRAVVVEHLERIAASELNAFTSVDSEAALARAEQLDSARDGGTTLGPLAGVPVGLKDLIDQAGRTTTCGSSFYRKTPSASASVVTRLEDAGAVIVGRTGLHEFAFGFSSENPWFGPVRNPWDPATSPGGSSGGSAAAVAAGLAAVGIGTDTGGSVRVPAALCGLVGLKVTHGRIPLTGVFPLVASIDTVGPLTATVEDARLVYEVLAGHDPADPWSARRPVTPSSAGLESIRVAVPHPWVDHPIEAAVQQGFDAALAAMEAAGATVTHVDAPGLEPPGLIAPGIGFEVANVHGELFRENPDAYGEEVAARVTAAFETTPDQYLDALGWRAQIRHHFDALFSAFDVVATPAVAAQRKRIGETELGIAGRHLHYAKALSTFTSLVNHAGLPALVVPLTVPERGLPASLQLIGPAWSESDLLGVGSELERLGISAFRPSPIHPRSDNSCN